jgi:hypothetical protein
MMKMIARFVFFSLALPLAITNNPGWASYLRPAFSSINGQASYHTLKGPG